jgi:two-component system chemotaxis sensor kinase CheA
MLLMLPKYVRRKPLGILLSSVLDAGSLTVNLDPDTLRADGLVGTAVVNDRLTLFLDIYRLADLLHPEDAHKAPPPQPERKRRILLVEDTKFFRQLVKGYLEGDGHEVTVAENGSEALTKLDEDTFDLVVSDIEMPVMDGWGFARAMRQRPDGANLPLMALTTLNSERDRARAMECGFDFYEVKVDRERFLAAVNRLLGAKKTEAAGASGGR